MEWNGRSENQGQVKQLSFSTQVNLLNLLKVIAVCMLYETI
jgi:hypothetical protein